MRITFLVYDLDGTGGTEGSVSVQASALADTQDVAIWSVVRTGDRHYPLDPRVEVRYLIDLSDADNPALEDSEALTPAQAKRLADRESSFVPRRWDRQFSALTDVALEQALPALDTDVVVSVTPGLLVHTTRLAPAAVVKVHQEHRSSSQRTSGMEPLLACAPLADAVVLLTDTMRDWLETELGSISPHTEVMPNPLPLGYRPPSLLDQHLVLAAGRLVPEKQYPKLLNAFAEAVAQPDVPDDWRLRICGVGPARQELIRLTRKHDLWDRIELPGLVHDMRGEWARASISALTSRAEGFPLVIQEAMAAGVPVASFDCASGPRAILTHDHDGLLVSPESVAGMATALHRLMTEPETRRRLGTAALASARSYDAHRLAEQWVRVYADARARRGSSAIALSRATSRPRVATRPAEASAPPGRPAVARHDLLTASTDALTSALGSADGAWFALPAPVPEAVTLVAPMSARTEVLAALADALPEWAVVTEPEDHGWPERRRLFPDAVRSLTAGRTPRIVLGPGSDDATRYGCEVAVEFWERSLAGTLVAPGRNGLTDAVSPDAAFERRSLDGLELPVPRPLQRPTVTEPGFDIDVVYTWVDGDDPRWDAARAERLAAMDDSDAGATAQTRESSGRARFVNHDELRWSLRSIDLFAPWVRRIHIVTAGQRPDWLDLDDPRINLVDHTDILPADALPTFNSHAIETSLHRIDGLAEHFVYFNDDFFLARPVGPSAFFDASGSATVFFSHTVLGTDEDPEAPPFLRAAWNNRRLLAGAFGQIPTRHLAHAPYAHRVSVLRDVEDRFADAVAATARSPFRSGDDVSVASSLAQHVGLLTGHAHEAEANLLYVNLTNADVDSTLEQAAADRAHDFICLGDQHDQAMRQYRLDETLAEFYRAFYPEPASWELD